MLKSQLPKVSVIIPTHNRKYQLFKCIESVLNSNYPRDRLEIIVVDDASTDGTYDLVREKYPHLKIIRSERELFVSGARNLGASIAKGQYVFFVDDDNIIERSCIRKLVEVLNFDESIGIVAPITLTLSGRINRAGGRRNMYTSINKKYFINEKYYKLKIPNIIYSDYVGNAFMVRRKILDIIKFDEAFYPFQHEDLDFSFKVRNMGYKIVIRTDAIVYDQSSIENNVLEKTNITSPIKAYLIGRNRIIFQRQWSSYLELFIFVILFLNIINIYHIFHILLCDNLPFLKRLNFIYNYIRGVVDGFVVNKNNIMKINRTVIFS